MAMTMKVAGMDQLSAMLMKLGDQAPAVAAVALYDGAKVMADAYSRADSQIRTEPFTHKQDRRLPSPEEKAALAGKTGVAKFRKGSDDVNTRVGIRKDAGYVQLGSSTVAVALIASSINSGTSFMDKQPVYRKATSTTRAAATDAIVRRAESEIERLSK